MQGIFSEELARLYTAEIVLAISHLHSLEFVHRDLKPVSFLLHPTVMACWPLLAAAGVWCCGSASWRCAAWLLKRSNAGSSS